MSEHLTELAKIDNTAKVVLLFLLAVAFAIQASAESFDTPIECLCMLNNSEFLFLLSRYLVQ